MQIRFLLGFVFILFISCSNKETLPEKKSLRIQRIAESHKPLLYPTNNKALEDLFSYVLHYRSNNALFDLNLFKRNYRNLLSGGEFTGDENEMAKWIQINALLFELTSDVTYVNELEKVFLKFQTYKTVIEPLFVTKDVDHLYVNIFQPTELNYSHSLGGDVSFKLETEYPDSGSVRLHFGMSIKRYIELYIRIPDWAEGTTVTVKQVKYFAQPGDYCKIAKKWKEGDVVEIELPIEKMTK